MDQDPHKYPSFLVYMIILFLLLFVSFAIWNMKASEQAQDFPITEVAEEPKVFLQKPEDTLTTTTNPSLLSETQPVVSENPNPNPISTTNTTENPGTEFPVINSRPPTREEDIIPTWVAEEWVETIGGVYPIAAYHGVKTVSENGEPLPVLVLHSHNAEAYDQPGVPRYVDYDDTLTVIQTGASFVQMLEERGIPVVHDTSHYMDEDYDLTYVETRKMFLERLPQEEFAMILDLHNDGMDRSYTTAVGPDGKEMAAFLFVISREDVANGPYGTNAGFARDLEREMEEQLYGISRGIYYNWDVFYNHDLHPASVVIEVGGYMNTVEEALRSLEYLADAVAAVYERGWQE